jgi:outer membrane protein
VQIRRSLLLMSFAVLLSGCALTQPTNPYAGMPALRTGTGPTSRAAPVEQARGPLTLSEAIRLALANNPNLAATARDVDVAGAQKDIAFGQRLPSLNAVGGYSHYLNSQRLIPAEGNNQPGVFSRNISAADLVLAMPLFTGGRITSQISAAELLQRAAEHRLARTRDELIYNVSSVFYGILAQRKVVESLEFSHKALQVHLKMVQDLIAAQKAARVDELRVQVRLADLTQQLVSERNVLAIQTRVLANLLGLGSSHELEPAGELALPGAAAPTEDQELKEALADRPDYLAARDGRPSRSRPTTAGVGLLIPATSRPVWTAPRTQARRASPWTYLCSRAGRSRPASARSGSACARPRTGCRGWSCRYASTCSRHC